MKKNAFIYSFLALAFFLVWKANEYSAPPLRPENCVLEEFQKNEAAVPSATAEWGSKLPWAQRGGFAGDASCLNKTPILGVVRISSFDDVKNALLIARAQGLKVSPSGQRHSMGGQSLARDGLVLDMKGLKGMELLKDRKTLRVQSGAVWSDVQNFLDREGLSVKSMQSINIFTVGGTLSVNAHGIAHDPGPIAPTVKSLRVMTADGGIKTASLSENPELFRHVLGGYGLFGVILDADLEVVDNEVYELRTQHMDYRDFPAFYKDRIENNPNLGLAYGRLSVSPTSYLTETAIHLYEKTDFKGIIPPLAPNQSDALARFVINFSKTGALGRWTRWMIEKYMEPSLHACIAREGSVRKSSDPCLVSRNQEMYDAMGYLKSRTKDTNILQEYFLPAEKMPEFIDGLRRTVKGNRANLLNVTLRLVRQDKITALPYAKGDRFAFVLYFNRGFDAKSGEILKKTTSDLIDLATGLGGTFYLPYQLDYAPEQLRKSYPEIDEVFAAKKRLDPDELFTNAFYEKYKN